MRESHDIGDQPDGGEQESQLESADDLYDEAWETPPFQPIRALGAALLIASGFGLYEYVLVSFWSVPWMGIHERTPWPAFALVAAAMLIAIAGLRLALSLNSPHAKLGFGLLAMLACIAIGVGGGRFISYLMRGTLNPPFTLKLEAGQKFPSFALGDQSSVTHQGPANSGAPATLIYIYRGDYDPFARYELADLTQHSAQFQRTGVNVIGVSADAVDRSKMLAGYLRTEIPLLGDASESILAPLGLVQHHRNGEPDNAIPAFIIVDRDGVVRWIFTSPYYRELPTMRTLLDAAQSVIAAPAAPRSAPTASP